tara:strand:+ start:36 stop:482 length:447 start_codon:yes stop_codon:yes gene_type:complete
MSVNTWKRGQFEVSTDSGRLDRKWLVSSLKKTYWAAANQPETILKSIDNSDVYGIYNENKHQVGFARLVTDRARFAWVSDVLIDPAFRRYGLGKWLIQTIVEDPQFETVHLWMLATDDAHGLYEQSGFIRSEMSDLREQLMHLSRPKR